MPIGQISFSQWLTHGWGVDLGGRAGVGWAGATPSFVRLIRPRLLAAAHAAAGVAPAQPKQSASGKTFHAASARARPVASSSIAQSASNPLLLCASTLFPLAASPLTTTKEDYT